jgi:hypothetical protein
MSEGAMLDPRIFGVDEIRQIEHYGRYTERVAIPRRFIWEKPRERELECLMIQWRIRERWFAAVIPAEPDAQGWLDNQKAAKSLRYLIEESRQR